MPSSLLGCVCSVENSYFVFLDVDKCYQVIKAHLSNHFSQFIILFILIVEEIALDFNAVVYIVSSLTNHVLSPIVTHIEDLSVEA